VDGGLKQADLKGGLHSQVNRQRRGGNLSFRQGAGREIVGFFPRVGPDGAESGAISGPSDACCGTSSVS
jgi:hypothetical protein